MLRHQIRGQLPVQRQHGDFANAGLSQQARLDFTQFDTEAANLHLMVDTSGVLDHAFRSVTGQVAGAIQATAVLRERVRHKAFGRQGCAVVITPRQTGMADMQLTAASQRYRVEVRVQHVPGQIRNRFANRAGGTQGVRLGDRAIGHVNRGFGDAVHIDQLRALVAKALEPGSQAGDVQSFAAKHNSTQCQWRLRFTRHPHQLLERRWRLVQHRDLLLRQQDMEVFRRTTDVAGHDDQATAVQQGAENLPDREVEGVGMEQRPHVLIVKLEPVIGGREQAHQVVMRQQRTFWLASGTRGVDHVGQVIRCRQVDR
ncbi:hypothetical protein ALP84_00518, partial [Pseudomonas cichorii]